MDNEIEKYESALAGIYGTMTGPGSPPMQTAERDALHHAIVALSIVGGAVIRIAAALEAHTPARPSEDGHNAL